MTALQPPHDDPSSPNQINLNAHSLDSPSFRTDTVRHSSHAAAEDYDSFNKRYADFFANAQDLFELQRGLNNCFAYDLVPSQQGTLCVFHRFVSCSTSVRGGLR
jgi:hypothetical protein